MKEERFLPIGSVVILSGGTKRAMITGYLSVDNKNTEKVYDYSGCMYPEGFLASNQTLLFNHDQIEKVFFKGFEDDEETIFMRQLNEIDKELKKSSKKTETKKKETSKKSEKLPEQVEVDTLDIEE